MWWFLIRMKYKLYMALTELRGFGRSLHFVATLRYFPRPCFWTLCKIKTFGQKVLFGLILINVYYNSSHLLFWLWVVKNPRTILEFNEIVRDPPDNFIYWEIFKKLFCENYIETVNRFNAFSSHLDTFYKITLRDHNSNYVAKQVQKKQG